MLHGLRADCRIGKSKHRIDILVMNIEKPGFAGLFIGCGGFRTAGFMRLQTASPLISRHPTSSRVTTNQRFQFAKPMSFKNIYSWVGDLSTSLKDAV